MKTTYIFRIILFFWGIASLLSSCNDRDEVTEKFRSIGFLGTISEGETMMTRDALIINNLTNKDYPTPIYIRMDVEDEVSEAASYQIKPGYEGRLASIDNLNDLCWKDAESNHMFYGWTLPWKGEDDNKLSNDYEKISFNPSYYKNQGLDEEDYYNCSVMEKFIGTKQGPVNYNENGEYVELRFSHLVSKIFISNITLITHEGVSYQNVLGEITFLNFPEYGYFYRHPDDEKAPYVAHPRVKEESVNSEDYNDVTYEISGSKAIYVCPEIDFKDVEFKIKVTWPEKHGITGEYYGNLQSVNIRRSNTETPEWDNNKESSKLYAGEVINLNLTLSQGKVTGVTAFINSWDTYDKGTSNNYSHKGLYSDTDAADFPGNAEDLYELYGEDGENGEKIFHVYNDVSLDSPSLEIDDGYILDGMGHTITMKPDESGNIRVKNVRDIYIKYGNKTIYIDKDGNIYTVDSDGKKSEQPSSKLNENLSTII